MAATDKPYRNQHKLNILFAISCVLMLLSILWMLERDYNRSYKEDQRTFRRAEELIFLRSMLTQLPSRQAVLAASDELAKARKALSEQEAQFADQQQSLNVQISLAKAEHQNWKALYDSRMSYRNLAAEQYGEESEEVKKYEQMLNPGGEIKDNLDRAQKDLDELEKRLAEEIDKPLKPYRDAVDEAQARVRSLTSEMDRVAKLVVEKGWGAAETARNLPIVDAFAAPTKVHQQYLPELTIDYGGFKRVPRFDRCTTCHLGIDRSIFDRESLVSLSHGATATVKDSLKQAHAIFKKRLENGEKLPFDLSKFPEEMGKLALSSSKITEFASHPRLDLFVDGNSPHPINNFGCTVCHRGQGSATEFNNASHTPNSFLQTEQWIKPKGEDGGHNYHSNHYWDFPMLPSRFTESSCLQCHHEVNDLIQEETKETAPKLLEGYRLVRDNGCFGCHDIAGKKAGREVGPDLRAEPMPPLEWLPPEERVKRLADEQNPPGELRRVGPGLRRLAEKTNEKWLHAWIANPRGFRPGTKMPHFFHLSTNSKEYLNKHAPDQENFPDAEIYAIARYLMAESQGFLNGKDTTRVAVESELKRLQGLLLSGDRSGKTKKELGQALNRLRDLALLSVPASAQSINDVAADLRRSQDDLFARKHDPEAKADSPQGQLIATIKQKTDSLLTLMTPTPIASVVRDSDGNVVDATLFDAKVDDAGKLRGRQLFSEKGCLACHSHMGTMSGGSNDAPNLNSTANFGPDLSRIAAKLGTGEEKSDRRWLVQWLLNPNIHNARTRMPVTHLTPAEANDIAGWLLSQNPVPYKADEIAKPALKTLQDMARKYLSDSPAVGRLNVEKILKEGLTKEYLSSLTESQQLKYDADEKVLLMDEGDSLQDKLLLYIGKKAIGRVGCFGCHDVPGYEGAKNIGTPLNDWGQKDPARIAFEDSVAYAETHLSLVDFVIDPKLVEIIRNLCEQEDGAFVQYSIQAAELHVKGDRMKQTQLGMLAKVALDKLSIAHVSARERLEQWQKQYAIDGEVEVQNPFNAEESKGKAKRPMERYFYDSLKDHQREGFLALKLMQPRSYDYGRLRTWEDRLRMPQFRFSRTKRRAEEELEDYKSRYLAESAGKYDKQAQLEEANAREAVMTFVLGLVAEEVPLQYLSKPKAESKDIVEGRKVLEKFNCAGCHQVQPGVYEMDLANMGNRQQMTSILTASLQQAQASLKTDHTFTSSNAWIGAKPPREDQRTIHGVDAKIFDDAGDPVEGLSLQEALKRPGNNNWLVNMRLAQAVHFTDAKGVEHNLPAGQSVTQIPLSMFKADQSTSAWGGTFSNLLTPYLRRKDNTKYGQENAARSALPPPLLREGERVRPNWLYQFLQNPETVRPQTVLRMPRFNLSSEEAQALVNYFAAVDRVNNPRIGLTEPFVAEPQQTNEYWATKNQQYVSSLTDAEKKAKADALKPLWALYLKDQVAEKQRTVDSLKSTIDSLDADAKGGNADAKAAQEAAKAALTKAEKALGDLKMQESKSDYSQFEKQWASHDAYAADAYRMLTDRTSACLTCHSVGSIESSDEKAPNLMLAAKRLRPAWTGQWIAFPDRLSAYQSVMPVNFPHGQEATGSFKIFKGSQRERALAIRDILMALPKIADRPVNRYYPLVPKGGK